MSEKQRASEFKNTFAGDSYFTVYYTAWNISNIVKMLSSVTDSIEGWVTVNVGTVVVL